MKNTQAIDRWALAGALMLLLALTAHAQTTIPSPTGITATQSPVLPTAGAPIPDPPAELVQRQAKLLNDSRQKQLVSDTQRLVVLANELKNSVDKSNKDTLSLDVIRKAEEIEKLARSVKEKMKGS